MVNPKAANSFPRMSKDECLLFKVYDKKADGPRFVFHTAFADPSTPAAAPPRKSLEVRTAAGRRLPAATVIALRAPGPW